MSEMTTEELEQFFDEMGYDAGNCFVCEDLGAIFLSGEGWICEPCYRELGGVPDDIGDELFDLIYSDDSLAREFERRISAAVDSGDTGGES